MQQGHALGVRSAIALERHRRGGMAAQLHDRLGVGAGGDQHIDVGGSEGMEVDFTVAILNLHPRAQGDTLEGAGGMDRDEQQRFFGNRQLLRLLAPVVQRVQAVWFAGEGEFEKRFEQTLGQNLMTEFAGFVPVRINAQRTFRLVEMAEGQCPEFPSPQSGAHRCFKE